MYGECVKTMTPCLGNLDRGRMKMWAAKRDIIVPIYHMGVVLKVLVKEGPLGIHFVKKDFLTKQRTYIMAILGTCILNNYHITYPRPRLRF